MIVMHTPTPSTGQETLVGSAVRTILGRSRSAQRPLRILIAFVLVCCTAAGDEITVVDDARQEVTIEARWIAEGKQAVALERRDGRWEVVPSDQIKQRTPKDGPEPLSAAELEQRLQQEFSGRLVSQVESPFVLAMIAAQPIEGNPRETGRRRQQLKRAMKFLQGMQKGVREFAADAEIELHEPLFPLVVLIFEHDEEFNRQVTVETQGDGLAAKSIASYYSLLSNRLNLRVRECRTFATPLHEAIHQQAHNRGVLKRLAPVPAWFNEGLATGFEGDGERLKSGPKAFNRKYASIAVNSRKINWADIVREDAGFRGDILAGEAYAQAWALHWWLYTRHRPEYRRLLQHYSQLEPLTEMAAQERMETFQSIVGHSPEELQDDFLAEARRLLKRN